MSLDIGLLIAGAKERGELESRVTNLLKEIMESGDCIFGISLISNWEKTWSFVESYYEFVNGAGNIILFIDEVHTIIGSGTVGKGGKASGLDIANLLKPPLGRGELQVIHSLSVHCNLTLS